MISIQTTPLIANNEDASQCTGCGRCCKRMPGILDASQIDGYSAQDVADLINRGYCFDSWHGDPRPESEIRPGTELREVYFIRPRSKRAANKIIDEPWGPSECMFLTDTGCSMSFDERPAQCRSLVPDLVNGCGTNMEKTPWGKQNMTLRWIPYQKVILEALDILYEQTDRPQFGPFHISPENIHPEQMPMLFMESIIDFMEGLTIAMEHRRQQKESLNIPPPNQLAA